MAKWLDLAGLQAFKAKLDAVFVKKDGAKVLSANDFTTTLKNKLDGITASAKPNQNAVAKVKVGTTTITATTEQDTIEIVAGSNVTLTPDATGKKVTVAAANTNTVYTHPTTAGNKHIPTGGSSGQVLGWNAAGEAKWQGMPASSDIPITNAEIDALF